MTKPTLDTLLERWSRGARDALDQLLTRLYGDIHAIAVRQLNHERHSALRPTALVHEAYLRLMSMREIRLQDRAHFLFLPNETLRTSPIRPSSRSTIASRTQTLAMSFALAVSSGCSSHRDITIDGPYHLVATDDEEQMSVCYDAADGCIGRIPPTVYAVGADATYIVAARHPQANRDITEYYYVVRSADIATVDTSVAVHGPFDNQAFETVRSELHLPVLSYEIRRLK